jgi:hypothetical protein
MKLGSTWARVALVLPVALTGFVKNASADPRAQAVASGVASQEMGTAQVEKSDPRAAGGASNGAADGSVDPGKTGNLGGGSPTGVGDPGSGSPASGIPGGLKSLPLGDSLEITAGTNGLFSLSDVSTQISLFAEARYRFTSFIQLGASLAYRYQSTNGVSDSAFQGLVGPTINLGLGEEGGLQSAFFISVLAGMTTGQSSFGSVVVSSSTELTGALSFGKRFALSKSVAFAPSVGVVKELNFDPNFTIQPVAFSIFF